MMCWASQTSGESKLETPVTMAISAEGKSCYKEALKLEARKEYMSVSEGVETSFPRKLITTLRICTEKRRLE